jgi:hypothetical protein
MQIKITDAQLHHQTVVEFDTIPATMPTLTVDMAEEAILALQEGIKAIKQKGE